MNQLEFAGKTVFISGAGTGIGAATAKLFAQRGADLVLVGRRAEKLQSVAKELAHYKRDVQTYNLDVNNLTAMEKLFVSLPRLDVAINNAGIEGSIGDSLTLEESDYDAVMNTNVKSLWFSMREQIRWFRRHQKAGAIINIASIAGIRGFPESSLYVTSKHAVIGLSQAVALEQIQHGIRVNVVSPGAIDTAMLRRIFSDNLSGVSANQPTKRVGLPEEIAEAIVWLASDKASFVVGHNFVVDGGKTISG